LTQCLGVNLIQQAFLSVKQAILLNSNLKISRLFSSEQFAPVVSSISANELK
ncbi:unnamed protein product, partial [Porites evermanni]